MVWTPIVFTPGEVLTATKLNNEANNAVHALDENLTKTLFSMASAGILATNEMTQANCLSYVPSGAYQSGSISVLLDSTVICTGASTGSSSQIQQVDITNNISMSSFSGWYDLSIRATCGSSNQDELLGKIYISPELEYLSVITEMSHRRFTTSETGATRICVYGHQTTLSW